MAQIHLGTKIIQERTLPPTQKVINEVTNIILILKENKITSNQFNSGNWEGMKFIYMLG